MRKINRWLTAVLGVTLMAGVMMGCGSGSSSEASASQGQATVEQEAVGEADTAQAENAAEKKTDSGDKIVVHIGDQPSFFILKVADEKGFFEEEFAEDNIEISVDNFVNQGSAIIEAMNAGDVDLGVVGALPFVAATANGSDFVALSSVNYSEDGFKLFAGPDSGVTEVADFKGKKVAVKFSSNEHQMLLTLLTNAGLTTDDVEIVNMSSEDGLNSLLNGDVAGAIIRGDQLQPAQEAGAIEVANNSESGPIANYLLGRREFIEENEDITIRVLQVLERTKQWIDENEDETIALFVDLTGSDEETVRTSFESRERSISVDEEKLAGPIQKSIDFSREQGIITADITVDDIIDTTYHGKAGIEE